MTEQFSDRFLSTAPHVRDDSHVCGSTKCDTFATSNKTRFDYSVDNGATQSGSMVIRKPTSESGNREQSYISFTMRKKHDGSSDQTD